MLRIGKVEVSCVNDGPFLLDGGTMFGVVPKALWERAAPVDERNCLVLACNCYLLSCDGRRLLIDAGMGRSWDEKTRAIYGLDYESATLIDNLAELGVGVGDVDAVLLTHLHFDHCGWATRADEDGEYRPTFPNAEYLVHDLEWADAHDGGGRDSSSYLDYLFDPLEACGQLRLLSGSEEIPVMKALTAIPTGGHTRGHLAWRIDSQGHCALGPSEICPLAAHRRPKWIMSYDLYPVETLEAKRQLLGAARDGGWALLLNHDPQTPAGRLLPSGEGKSEFAAIAI